MLTPPRVLHGVPCSRVATRGVRCAHGTQKLQTYGQGDMLWRFAAPGHHQEPLAYNNVLRYTHAPVPHVHVAMLIRTHGMALRRWYYLEVDSRHSRRSREYAEMESSRFTKAQDAAAVWIGLRCVGGGSCWQAVCVCQGRPPLLLIGCGCQGRSHLVPAGCGCQGRPPLLPAGCGCQGRPPRSSGQDWSEPQVPTLRPSRTSSWCPTQGARPGAVHAALKRHRLRQPARQHHHILRRGAAAAGG